MTMYIYKFIKDKSVALYNYDKATYNAFFTAFDLNHLNDGKNHYPSITFALPS